MTAPSLPAPVGVSDEPERGSFTVRQGGMTVASGSGPLDAVRREAAHYAAMYRQDGPVEVRVRRERRRTPKGVKP